MPKRKRSSSPNTQAKKKAKTSSTKGGRSPSTVTLPVEELSILGTSTEETISEDTSKSQTCSPLTYSRCAGVKEPEDYLMSPSKTFTKANTASALLSVPSRHALTLTFSEAPKRTQPSTEAGVQAATPSSQSLNLLKTPDSPVDQRGECF